MLPRRDSRERCHWILIRDLRNMPTRSTECAQRRRFSSCRRVTPITNLAGALAPEYNLDRLKENVDIEKDAVVLQVVQIVLKFFARIVDRHAIRIQDLRPASNARFHIVSQIVVRDGFLTFFHKLWSLGARADKTQIAFQYIDQLWKFVDSRISNDTPDIRYSPII